MTVYWDKGILIVGNLLCNFQKNVKNTYNVIDWNKSCLKTSLSYHVMISPKFLYIQF